jgi:hypothetical protein
MVLLTVCTQMLRRDIKVVRYRFPSHHCPVIILNHMQLNSAIKYCKTLLYQDFYIVSLVEQKSGALDTKFTAPLRTANFLKWLSLPFGYHGVFSTFYVGTKSILVYLDKIKTPYHPRILYFSNP